MRLDSVVFSHWDSDLCVSILFGEDHQTIGVACLAALAPDHTIDRKTISSRAFLLWTYQPVELQVHALRRRAWFGQLILSETNTYHHTDTGTSQEPASDPQPTPHAEL